jgi:hypothetical protein
MTENPVATSGGLWVSYTAASGALQDYKVTTGVIPSPSPTASELGDYVLSNG